MTIRREKNISGYLDSLEAGTFQSLSEIHKYLFDEIYEFAGRIRDVNILLKQSLTDKINDREVYRKGIDHSYYYEGYSVYKIQELMQEKKISTR